TARTLLYSLSLHDALPISPLVPLPSSASLTLLLAEVDLPLSLPGSPTCAWLEAFLGCEEVKPVHSKSGVGAPGRGSTAPIRRKRSEEHTSELQSRFDLVCR